MKDEAKTTHKLSDFVVCSGISIQLVHNKSARQWQAMPTGIICKKASVEPKQYKTNSIKIIPHPIRLEQHDTMLAK